MATNRIVGATPRRDGVLKAAVAGFAVLVIALLAAAIALTVLTGDVTVPAYGAGLLVPLVVLGVGALLSWKRPSNRIGWIALASAFVLVLGHVVRLYAVLDYHLHHGRLPLGATSVFLGDTVWPYGFILLSLILLLFPDGLVPSRGWRVVLWLYLGSVCRRHGGLLRLGDRDHSAAVQRRP